MVFEQVYLPKTRWTYDYDYGFTSDFINFNLKNIFGFMSKICWPKEANKYLLNCFLLCLKIVSFLGLLVLSFANGGLGKISKNQFLIVLNQFF